MTAHTNRLAAIALCAIACCSCRHKKAPVPVMIPPPATTQTTAKPPPPPPPPPELPPSQSGTVVTPPPAVSEANLPGPPKKKRKAAKKTPKTDTPTTQSVEAQQPASAVAQTPPASPHEAQPAAVPSLGQMLTDDQRRDYETQIHDALERARANLRKARGNTKLTEAQQRMASQVETFVAQAEDRSKTDLVSARSLAERADLLAKDLAESLQ